MWLAGFLEGEGSFGVYTSTYKKADRPRAYTRTAWVIQVNGVDRDTIERAADLMGSRVVKRPARSAQYQDQWATALGRRKDVIALIEELRPHMGKRRQAKIDELLAAHASA